MLWKFKDKNATEKAKEISCVYSQGIITFKSGIDFQSFVLSIRQ